MKEHVGRGRGVGKEHVGRGRGVGKEHVGCGDVGTHFLRREKRQTFSITPFSPSARLTGKFGTGITSGRAI